MRDTWERKVLVEREGKENIYMCSHSKIEPKKTSMGGDGAKSLTSQDLLKLFRNFWKSSI